MMRAHELAYADRGLAKARFRVTPQIVSSISTSTITGLDNIVRHVQKAFLYFCVRRSLFIYLNIEDFTM